MHACIGTATMLSVNMLLHCCHAAVTAVQCQAIMQASKQICSCPPCTAISASLASHSRLLIPPFKSQIKAHLLVQGQSCIQPASFTLKCQQALGYSLHVHTGTTGEPGHLWHAKRASNTYAAARLTDQLVNLEGCFNVLH